MKKLPIVLLSLSLLVLVSCSSRMELTRNSKPHNVALTSFQVELNNFDSDDFYNGNYGSLLLSLRDDAMENANLRGVYMAFDKSQNKDVKAELDSTYTIVKDTLKKYNWNLKPVNYLKKKIQYDNYGFPDDGKIKKEINTNATLHILMSLSVNNLQTNYESPGNFQICYQPELEMIIKMINSQGKTIWKGNTVVDANNDIVINEDRLSGIPTFQVQQIPSLSSMVKRAVHKMLPTKQNTRA